MRKSASPLLPAALIPALCIVLAGGCEVAAVDPLPRAGVVNECEDDGDGCGTPADASECRDGRRVACQGGFSTLLLEINAPASGGLGSGLSYLWREDGVDLEGETWEILLPQLATVKGAVRTAPYVMYPSTDTPCQLLFEGSEPGLVVAAGSDRSIPVTVSFTPADRVLGVSSAGYLAKVETEEHEGADPEAPETLEFEVKVPPGEYDLYVEPKAPAEGGCEFPPYLLRRARAQSGSVPLDIELPVPSRFDLTVPAPSADEGAHLLEGWTVDMLDPISGRVISTAPKLTARSDDELGATLFYFPPGLDADESELVRLSPPKGITAPTIVLARSALELFSVGSGVVAEFEGYPAAVRVEGQVAVAGSPAGATVTLTATSIEGVGDGVFASFVRSLQVGAEGTFEVDLLPGTYRVLAVPDAEQNSGGQRTLAATEVDWVIAPEPALQAGKVVELQPIKHIHGQAFLPGSDEPVLGAIVTAVASPRELQVDLLRQAAEGRTGYVPTAESATVAADGSFDVRADPGDFDLSVRPSDSSGFAWGVRHVKLPQEEPEAGLGSFMLPFPVPYKGTVSVAGMSSAPPVDNVGGASGQVVVEPLSQALIRAYVYLSEDGTYIDEPTEAVAVVQVAETRANINGEFELLIPANLN